MVNAKVAQRSEPAQSTFSMILAFGRLKKIRRRKVAVFACLGSPDDFLSAIFGILSKFRVDIGKTIFGHIFS